MKNKLCGTIPTIFLFLLATIALPDPALSAAEIIIDHASVDSFSRIPDPALSAAKRLRVMLRIASVGGNIYNGLNALSSRNAKYNHGNWQFQSRGNPGAEAKITDFVNEVAAHYDNFDVLSMKFCFIDARVSFADYRDAMNNLEAEYPSKRFVWWTMPITIGDGASPAREAFNNKVRSYARDNNKILFDIADIESYDTDGQACTYQGYEALCGNYAADIGHLNGFGSQRVAQAFWCLMARIASGDGD